MPEATSYPAPTYDCCTVRDIKEIYGAGNEAEQDGAVTMILGCVDNMDYVYGGAKNAHVKGGVDLVVTSGHFKGVYGGNDTSGSIQGPITVTIEETGCDPLVIDNLYLGGKDAAYSVYGYKNTGTEVVARTKAEYDALTDAEKTAEGLPYADPVLNIVSCTRIGKESGEDLGGAFGGGYGAGATMYGNPTVNVNMIAGKYADQIDRDGDKVADDDATALGIVRNVYGGGEQADVEGNTTVNIGTVTTVKLRSDMGAPIAEEEQTSTNVLGALITDNVFGAGKGKNDNIESAFVSGNTEVNICTADYSEVAGFKGISIAKSVYGGGQLSQVGGNTNITVSGGTIGTSGQGGATYGNIYGGGFGHNDNVRFGLVKGNTNVTVTGGNVLHSVYGGGAYGSVGTYTYASEDANAAITGRDEEAGNTGKATITILGGTVGTNGHNNGMIFGASRGDIAAPGAIQDNMAWVYDTDVIIGTEGDEENVTTPSIKGSVYGSGENGHTFHDAKVTINSGMVGVAEGTPVTDDNGTPEDASDDITYSGAAYPYRGNVYGGGCGTDKYYPGEIPSGHSEHDGQGDKYNKIAGIVGGDATVTINGGHVVRNVYGAGAMGSVTGGTTVNISGKSIIGVNGSGGGDVYAAARGNDGMENDCATVGSTALNISGGTIWGSAFGGGQLGTVKGSVEVYVSGGVVTNDVYGGGALAQTNTEYDAADDTKRDYVTTVTYDVAGQPQYNYIRGDLYGGGLGQLGDHPIEADVNGPVEVIVKNGTAKRVFGCNNLNGMPKSTVKVDIKGTTSLTSGSAIRGVYGGGNQAAYIGSPIVEMSGGKIGYVYGGGLGSTAIITGSTSVKISGGTVEYDVYGGGSEADVTENVSVLITGGKVTRDVYGGGALAETNTANWEKGSKDVYIEVVGLSTEKYVVRMDIVAGISSVDGLYTRSGSEGNYTYTPASGLAQDDTNYYELLSASSLKGLYTRSGSEGNYTYTEITEDQSYIGSGTYYEKRTIPGDWKTGMNESASEPVAGRGPDPKKGTKYKTLVTLTGGVVGNVYGGGLGRLTDGGEGPVAANVYGDVRVSINRSDSIAKYTGSGVAFTNIPKDVTTSSGTTYSAVPTTGRVFGCNNLYGCPLGDRCN